VSGRYAFYWEIRGSRPAILTILTDCSWFFLNIRKVQRFFLNPHNFPFIIIPLFLTRCSLTSAVQKILLKRAGIWIKNKEFCLMSESKGRRKSWPLDSLIYKQSSHLRNTLAVKFKTTRDGRRLVRIRAMHWLTWLRFSLSPSVSGVSQFKQFLDPLST
jgi:hypothetical protein